MRAQSPITLESEPCHCILGDRLRGRVFISFLTIETIGERDVLGQSLILGRQRKTELWKRYVCIASASIRFARYSRWYLFQILDTCCSSSILVIYMPTKSVPMFILVSFFLMIDIRVSWRIGHARPSPMINDRATDVSRRPNTTNLRALRCTSRNATQQRSFGRWCVMANLIDDAHVYTNRVLCYIIRHLCLPSLFIWKLYFVTRAGTPDSCLSLVKALKRYYSSILFISLCLLSFICVLYLVIKPVCWIFIASPFLRVSWSRMTGRFINRLYLLIYFYLLLARKLINRWDRISDCNIYNPSRSNLVYPLYPLNL
jgi:hypothetical protein